jgi:hypothetical protein
MAPEQRLLIMRKKHKKWSCTNEPGLVTEDSFDEFDHQKLEACDATFVEQMTKFLLRDEWKGW